jgi:predicted ATPase
MLQRLRLVRFKNFEKAELSMGPFTLLVGANASGKSNLREALRFLHGVGRGYSLAEIFGGKWSAGERQWEGLRGGVAEVSFRKGDSFGIEAEMTLSSDHGVRGEGESSAHFCIDVESGARPRVLRERLSYTNVPGSFYDSDRDWQMSESQDYFGIWNEASSEEPFQTDSAILSQMQRRNSLATQHSRIGDTLHVLSSMRFPDLSPEAMRQPSVPGQRVLSDRGENLSSVLQHLCAREDTKAELIHWVRALTPMDVADLQFPADLRGQVLLVLVEKNGTALSAYSASDGTLRFLGMLAALLSPEPGLVFFEEIENGLHPSRLRLLIDLIRTRTREGMVQVVATTHSPTLLALLDDEMLQHASLVYRLEGEPSAQITHLLDVPDAARVMAEHDRADLLASGWFEDMVEFAATPREPLKKAAFGDRRP